MWPVSKSVCASLSDNRMSVRVGEHVSVLYAVAYVCVSICVCVFDVSGSAVKLPGK